MSELVEKYGSLTRGQLIEAMAWHMESVRLQDGRTLNRAEAIAVAHSAARVVGEFINWVEQLQRVQMEALSFFAPNIPKVRP